MRLIKKACLRYLLAWSLPACRLFVYYNRGLFQGMPAKSNHSNVVCASLLIGSRKGRPRLGVCSLSESCDTITAHVGREKEILRIYAVSLRKEGLLCAVQSIICSRGTLLHVVLHKTTCGPRL